MERAQPHMRLLSESQCDQILHHARKILETRGIRVDSSALRRRLAGIGANVESSSHLVMVPDELIKEAVEACPDRFCIHDLDGNAMTLRAGSVYDMVGTYVEAVQWLDDETGRLRPSSLEDLKQAVRLADALPIVRRAGIIVWPMDIASSAQTRVALRTLLSNTRKSLTFGIQNTEQAQEIAESLLIATKNEDMRSKPVATFTSSATSPMVVGDDSGAVLIEAMKHGLVPIIAACPMAGATSPFSLVGTVLQQTVENLFMLVAKHAIAPGWPVLWGGGGGAMDMRTGDVSYGGIERSLIMLANIDLARRLDLPCHSPAGSIDSCQSDLQAGVEKTWTYLTRVLSDAATGIGIGAVTNGKAVSLCQMVLDADILACARRFGDGMNMDLLPVAKKEIRDVACGGDFMEMDSTLALLREGAEYVYPVTFNRNGSEGKSMTARGQERVEQLLADWGCPVSRAIAGELERWAEAA